jgi:hypothetical protein
MQYNMKKEKIYLVECANSGGYMSSRSTRYSYQEGTLETLISAYSYTLECGASYQHERGNSKINQNPKTIGALITNLNKAANNSAANGYSGKSYSLVTERKNNDG